MDENTPEKKIWEEEFDLDALKAGGYSALDSALFGIPTAIVKAASKDAYKKLLKLREDNKIASNLGDIGGMLLPTGGLLAKGVGTAAKAGAKALGGASKAAKGLASLSRGADTLADIIKTGGKLKGPTAPVVRGALAAAEQSIPRVLTGQQDLQDAGTNVLLGGALGGATSLASKGIKRIPELLKKASKWGNKTMLTAADVDSRTLRQQAKYLGNNPEKAEALVKKVAQSVRDKKLYREPVLDAYRKEISDEWKFLANSFDKQNIKIANQVDFLKSTPEVADVLARGSKKAEDSLNTLITKVDNTKNFAGKRQYLNDLIYSDKTPDETKILAKAIQENIERTAANASGMDLSKMKEEYPIKKILEMADFRDELSTKGAGIQRGSDTAAKLAIAGLGVGAAGGASQIKGVIDDPSSPEAWMRLVAATAAPIAVGSLSKQISLLLARLAMRLDPDDIALLGKKVASGLTKADVDELVLLSKKIDMPFGPEEIEKFAVRDGAERINKVTDSLTKGFSHLESPTLVGAKAAVPMNSNKIENVVEKIEDDSTEEVKKEAKVALNQKYLDTLKNVMMSDYRKYFAGSMSYDEFERKVAELTDNFQPLKTANILFRDPKRRDQYLKEYKVALTVSNANFDEVTKPVSFIDGIFNPGKVVNQKKAYADFIDVVSSMVSKEGALPTTSEKKEVAADIKIISDLNATPEEKRELLLNKLEEKYNLSVSKLRNMGVI